MTNFNDEKPVPETELCFAVTIAMLNFLTLAATSGMVWFLYSLLTQPGLFEISMREFQLL